MADNHSYRQVRIAVVQEASAFLDRDACLEKVRVKAQEAVLNGASLVVFPEAFIPGYPRGLSFGTVVGSRSRDGRRLYERFWNQSISVSGPEFEQLREIAATLSIMLAIGVIERAEPGGTMYCSFFIFDANGEILLHHRKIKPTGSERVIWGEGDGTSLFAVESEIGRIGSLICWENYMPLARTALYESGVEIYLAPTADQRDTWQATMRHIACEGRCFVIGCNQFSTIDHYPDDLRSSVSSPEYKNILSHGGSVVVNPMGEVIAGPIFDEPGMLIAEIDLGEIIQARMDLDVCGHYARPDILSLCRNSIPQANR